MAKRKKIDLSLASEIFEDASLSDNFPEKVDRKTLVKLSELVSNPHQPRIQMDEENIIELANSISENGLLQPITVLDNNDDTYTIVFGHRRAAAYAFLNNESIEATIMTSLDDKDLVIAPIVENLQRKDMQPIETAIALDKVLKMKVITTQEDLSKSIGLSQSRVSKLLSILKLSQSLLEEVKVSKYKDATVLAALNKITLNQQLDIFNTIKNLKRDDALIEIKKATLKKETTLKRVIHSNSSIKINTKGIDAETKKKVIKQLKIIEELLK